MAADAKKVYRLIKNGDLRGLERLLEDDPELLNRNIVKGYSMLTLSVSKSARKPEISNWLVSKGADLDRQETKGFTALMLACKFDQPDTARFLVEKGADINLVNYDGWTALMMAAAYDQPEITKLLIEKDAFLDLRTDRGKTALMLACQTPHEEHHTTAGMLRSIKHLYAAGAAVDVRDHEGFTAIETAKRFKRRDAVDFLRFAESSSLSKILRREMELPRHIIVVLHDFEVKTVKKCKKIAAHEWKAMGVHHSLHRKKLLLRFNPSSKDLTSDNL